MAVGCGNETTTTTTAGGTETTAGGPATTAGPTTTAASTETTMAAGEPVMGGIVKTGTVSHPSRFGFPAKVFGPDQFFEGLFLEMMFNPTNEADVFTPQLAESWELTPDKLAYIFHLRKGVKFHDGTDFNAAAAKFCWDLNLAAPPAAGAETTTTAAAPPTTAAGGPPAGGPPPGPAGPPPDFAFVKSIEVVDDYTVKVNLKQWTNQVLTFIGRKSWAVFSPTAFQEKGAEYLDTHPVGTGAFMLKSFTPDQSMVLEKNPNYWGKDAQGRQLPYLDGIDITIFGDPNTMTMALQAGQIDGTDQVALVGAQQLQNDPKFILGNFGGPDLMMEMNTTDPASVWSDIKMRQALEYAIDKEGIAKSVGMGFTPAIYEVIHSVKEVVDPGTTPRTYDPEKAKALMAEAGHPTVECTISYDTNRTDPNLPDAVAANLAAVGINGDPERYEYRGVLCDQHQSAAGQRHDLPRVARRSSQRSARGDRDVRQGDHLLPGLLAPGGVLHPHGEGTAVPDHCRSERRYRPDGEDRLRRCIDRRDHHGGLHLRDRTKPEEHGMAPRQHADTLVQRGLAGQVAGAAGL